MTKAIPMPSDFTPEQIADWLDTLPKNANFRPEDRKRIYEVAGVINPSIDQCQRPLTSDRTAYWANRIREHQVHMVTAKLTS